MKKLLVLATSVVALSLLTSLAQAADLPTKQEGRIWIDQNFTLAITPQWSFTVMPGARMEFARTRESHTGLHFVEVFIGPNYTHKMGNMTLKGSLWYYYMGYPGRGRQKEIAPYEGDTSCSTPPIGSNTTCTSTYNFSHNLEIIPSIDYRWGRWSIFDRVILHNTFYADVYSAAMGGKSVSDLRWGWGTTLRELLQVRYGLTDRMGVFMSDEVFLTLIEDGDTSSLKNSSGASIGYNPAGYWKSGFRSNRIYTGIDFKLTPNVTVVPMYMVDFTMNPTDSADLTDVAHTFFMIVTVTSSMFGNK